MPHFSASVIGGLGSFKASAVNPTYPDDRFFVQELGAQLVGYPLRDFSSLQLGGQVMWVHLSANEYDGRKIEANAGGVSIGPFVGYKHISRLGFTTMVQGGFQYMVARASVTDSGTTGRAETDEFGLLLNLKFGWSF
ncbi:MAG: hypothetical protein QM756_02540 [Polyangiaceae bacterium]